MLGLMPQSEESRGRKQVSSTSKAKQLLQLSQAWRWCWKGTRAAGGAFGGPVRPMLLLLAVFRVWSLLRRFWQWGQGRWTWKQFEQWRDSYQLWWRRWTDWEGRVDSQTPSMETNSLQSFFNSGPGLIIAKPFSTITRRGKRGTHMVKIARIPKDVRRLHPWLRASR